MVMEMNLIKYIVISLIYSSFFYLLYGILLDKRAGNGVRRIYLLLSVACTALLPLVHIVNAGNPVVQIILPAIVITPHGTKDIMSDSASAAVGFHFLIWVFYSVSALFMVILVREFTEIILNIYRGRKDKLDEYIIISGDRIKGSFSFGRYIFISQGNDKEEENKIISHEMAHIKYLHTADLLFVSILRCIQWFNPFYHLILKELFAVHEYQADSAVLRSGENFNDYRELIVKQQFGYSPVIVNNLKKSLTFKRLKEMEHFSKRKGGFFLLLLAVILSSGVAVAISCTNIEKPVTLQSDQHEDIIPIVDTPDAPLPAQDTISFTIVGKKPVFNGGDENSFTKWVFSRLVYPEQAKAKGIQGKVVVSFLVNTDGKVTDVKVLRRADPYLDAEAMRVIASSPKWEPGMNKDKKVVVQYVFPVIFQLR
jgi:TonB family protein